MTTSGCDSGLYPGDNYPDWLTFNCDGSSVIFDVPQVSRLLFTLRVKELKSQGRHENHPSISNMAR